MHDLGMQGFKPLCACLTYPVLQRLDFAPQNRKGRSQLMGNIGNPLLPQLLILIQSSGHLVEIPGKLAQLIGAVHVDPGVKLAGGEAAGALDQLLHRCQQMARQQKCHNCRKQKRENADQVESPGLLL